VTFYDLAPEARWPLVLHLAGAAWSKGRAMTIHCADLAGARALDEYLWVSPEDGFLPHEVAEPGAPLDDDQARVVLVTGDHTPLERQVLVQEAPASIDFAASFAQVVDLVDHTTPEALAASRARFRAWREREITPEVRKDGS
jgi:DNA polymerase IIIc chi subunit